MLVLLPPSETKALGGNGPALNLDTLSFPELSPVRRKIADALVELAADPAKSLTALGLSPRQEHEALRNQTLWTSATLPALKRYTGVLYDALDFAGMTRAGRAKAENRIIIASALFGVVRGSDQVPGYRLSGNSMLPALGGLPRLWRPTLEPMLAGITELVVDLRSGTYMALAPIPNAYTVQVITVDSAGRQKTVSHHNKAYKGKLAAVLSTARSELSTLDKVLKTARTAGLRLEQITERELQLVTSLP